MVFFSPNAWCCSSRRRVLVDCMDHRYITYSSHSSWWITLSFWFSSNILDFVFQISEAVVDSPASSSHIIRELKLRKFNKTGGLESVSMWVWKSCASLLCHVPKPYVRLSLHLHKVTLSEQFVSYWYRKPLTTALLHLSGSRHLRGLCRWHVCTC